MTPGGNSRSFMRSLFRWRTTWSSHAGKHASKLVEVYTQGFHRRCVSGVEAPVDKTDKRFGRKRDPGEVLVRLGLPKGDGLCDIEHEMPLWCDRRHSYSSLGPV